MQVIDNEFADFSLYPAYHLHNKSPIPFGFDCSIGIWKLSLVSITGNQYTKWRVTWADLWRLDFIIYSPSFWFSDNPKPLSFDGFLIKSFSLLKVAFLLDVAFFRFFFRFHNTTGFDSINSVHTV